MWRYLVLGCLLLCLGFGALVWVRAGEWDRFERALGDPRVAALLADAPPLDAALQARLWQWMQQGGDWPGGWSTSLDEDWFLAGQARPPARLVEEHERLRAPMEELTGMLATGRACLTSLGWIQQTVQQERDAFDGFPLRLASGARLYAAARWYAYEAMRSQDPTEALARLERLCRATSHPGGIIDGMQARRVRGFRDRTWLRLLLRGRVSEALARPWLEEPSHEIERLAQATRLDRILFGMTVGRDLAAERHLDCGEDLDLQERARWWWQGAGDVATWLQLCRAFEDYLGGCGSAEEVWRLEDMRQAREGRPLASDGIHAAFLRSAVHGNAQHRLARVAAHVLRFLRREGRLPRDGRELRAWMGAASTLLDSAPFDFALAYERTSGDRFRVHVDPETPLPALLDESVRENIRAEQEQERQGEAVLRWFWPHTLEIRVPRS